MTIRMIGNLVIAGAVGALIRAGVVATAAPEFHTIGNRFKPLAYTDLNPEQKTFADKEIAAGRNPSTGPFNIYLRSPQFAELSRPLGDYLRFKAPMPRKFKEIAIMLTSRYWGGQYVWYSHRQQALDACGKPAGTPVRRGHRCGCSWRYRQAYDRRGVPSGFCAPRAAAADSRRHLALAGRRHRAWPR